MGAHGCAGGGGVAGAQRFEHGGVLFDHGLDVGAAGLFVQQRAFGRIRAQGPEPLDRLGHGGVARGPRDGQGKARSAFSVPCGLLFSLSISSTNAASSARPSSVIVVAARAAASPSNNRRASVSSKAEMLKPGMSPLPGRRRT